jgi:hypothetical protein
MYTFSTIRWQFSIVYYILIHGIYRITADMKTCKYIPLVSDRTSCDTTDKLWREDRTSCDTSDKLWRDLQNWRYCFYWWRNNVFDITFTNNFQHQSRFVDNDDITGEIKRKMSKLSIIKIIEKIIQLESLSFHLLSYIKSHNYIIWCTTLYFQQLP